MINEISTSTHPSAGLNRLWWNDDIDGALSVLSDKIKYVNPERHNDVLDSTRTARWDEIQCADDAFDNLPGVF